MPLPLFGTTSSKSIPVNTGCHFLQERKMTLTDLTDDLLFEIVGGLKIEDVITTRQTF